MKRLFAITTIALTIVSCQKFDDTAIWNKLNEQTTELSSQESRIKTVENGNPKKGTRHQGGIFIGQYLRFDSGNDRKMSENCGKVWMYPDYSLILRTIWNELCKST